MCGATWLDRNSLASYWPSSAPRTSAPPVFFSPTAIPLTDCCCSYCFCCLSFVSSLFSFLFSLFSLSHVSLSRLVSPTLVPFLSQLRPIPPLRDRKTHPNWGLISLFNFLLVNNIWWKQPDLKPATPSVTFAQCDTLQLTRFLAMAESYPRDGKFISSSLFHARVFFGYKICLIKYPFS